tara:strand:+ start:1629 stop:1817 length:189 start_codon:yes stop_codon:yes gene_type:complete
MKKDVVKKVIAWRVLSTSIGVFITYLFLDDVQRSIAITGTFVVIMTALHYTFETFWEKYYKK